MHGHAKSRTQHIEKQGMPNCRWTKCPALNPVVSDNVLKQSGLLPRLKGSICGNQLGKAWYIQRQEMTRNTTIPCTTTFTSVKCVQPRVINIFAWGSAQPNRVISTPDSIDCQDEHELGLFSIGREAAQISGKLATVDLGLLGPSGGTGVPNRVYFNNHKCHQRYIPQRQNNLRLWRK